MRAESWYSPFTFFFQEVKCGDFKAVIVEVSGQAHYTGTASFIVEDDDPLRDGFLLKWLIWLLRAFFKLLS